MNGIYSPDLAITIGSLPMWYIELRHGLTRGVHRVPLFRGVMRGDERAITALLSGFWGYVVSYGACIARRSPANHARVAEAIDNASTLALIIKQQADIRACDGSHMELWRALATSCNIELCEPSSVQISSSVRYLLEGLDSQDDADFYIGVTTTQVIGWALSVAIRNTPLYQRSHTGWFDVHLAPHAPSHEQMYRWIAWKLLRTTGDYGHREYFERCAWHTLSLFRTTAWELYSG